MHTTTCDIHSGTSMDSIQEHVSITSSSAHIFIFRAAITYF